MDTNSKLIEVLNDLIKINHDRTEGYVRASDELKPADIDLKAIFSDMARSSTRHANELAAEVVKLGGKAADNTTNPGKIYRVWMDIRSTLSGLDRKSVLALCEFGEDAALKAYREALVSDAGISAELSKIITDQRDNIQASHDLIKKYRDTHEAIDV